MANDTDQSIHPYETVDAYSTLVGTLSRVA